MIDPYIALCVLLGQSVGGTLVDGIDNNYFLPFLPFLPFSQALCLKMSPLLHLLNLYQGKVTLSTCTVKIINLPSFLSCSWPSQDPLSEAAVRKRRDNYKGNRTGGLKMGAAGLHPAVLLCNGKDYWTWHQQGLYCCLHWSTTSVVGWGWGDLSSCELGHPYQVPQRLWTHHASQRPRECASVNVQFLLLVFC